MIIEEAFTIDAPRHEVVTFFLDVERMSRCVPGVESLTAVGTNEYEATLSVQLGPIHARFAGRVAIDDGGSPDMLVAVASGRDTATGSMAQVRFAAELTEMPGPLTRVESKSDVSIRGRLGQFGTGVVSSTARTMVREFASCADRAVEEGGVAAPTAPPMATAIRRGFVAYLADLWSRVWRRVAGTTGRDEGQEP